MLTLFYFFTSTVDTPLYRFDWLQYHAIALGSTFMIFTIVNIISKLAVLRPLHAHAFLFMTGKPSEGWAMALNIIVIVLLNIGILEGFKDGKNEDVAHELIITAFALQSFILLLVFIFFTGLCIRSRHFLWQRSRSYEHKHEQQHQEEQKDEDEDKQLAKKARRVTVVVWLATLLMLLRTLFRLAETVIASSGNRSVVANELYFGFFEFAPVVVAVWLLGIWHHGDLFWRGYNGVEASMTSRCDFSAIFFCF